MRQITFPSTLLIGILCFTSGCENSPLAPTSSSESSVSAPTGSPGGGSSGPTAPGGSGGNPTPPGESPKPPEGTPQPPSNPPGNPPEGGEPEGPEKPADPANPPAAPIAPGQCTNRLSLDPSFANDVITVRLHSNIGEGSPKAQAMFSVDSQNDYGNPVSTTVGETATFPFKADDKEHRVFIKASYVGQNGATCETVDSITIPAKPKADAGPPAVSFGKNHLCSGAVQGVSCKVTAVSGKRVTVTFTNNSDSPKEVHLSVYKQYNLADYSTQELMRENSSSAMLSAGQSVALSATLPDCAWQLDAYVGPLIIVPPHPPAVLIGFEIDNSNICKKSPTCEGAKIQLTKKNEKVTDTTVSGVLVVSLSEGVTGMLTMGDQSFPVNDGKELVYNYTRPAPGQPVETHTHTLKGSVSGDRCPPSSVTITVPPQEKEKETCPDLKLVPKLAYGEVPDPALRSTRTRVLSSATWIGGAEEITIKYIGFGERQYRRNNPPNAWDFDRKEQDYWVEAEFYSKTVDGTQCPLAKERIKIPAQEKKEECPDLKPSITLAYGEVPDPTMRDIRTRVLYSAKWTGGAEEGSFHITQGNLVFGDRGYRRNNPPNAWDFDRTDQDYWVEFEFHLKTCDGTPCPPVKERIKIPAKPKKVGCKLEIVKSVDKTSARLNDLVTFELRFRNIGDAVCTGGGVHIEDDLDPDMQFKSTSQSSNVSAGYNGPVLTQRTVHFNGHELDPGESGWAKIVVQLCAVKQYLNKARITAAEINWQWIHSNSVSVAVSQ